MKFDELKEGCYYRLPLWSGRHDGMMCAVQIVKDGFGMIKITYSVMKDITDPKAAWGWVQSFYGPPGTTILAIDIEVTPNPGQEYPAAMVSLAALTAAMGFQPGYTQMVKPMVVIPTAPNARTTQVTTEVRTIRCECGVDKVGGNHSSWCPKA